MLHIATLSPQYSVDQYIIATLYAMAMQCLVEGVGVGKLRSRNERLGAVWRRAGAGASREVISRPHVIQTWYVDLKGSLEYAFSLFASVCHVYVIDR
jgi:hypothetical protein